MSPFDFIHAGLENISKDFSQVHIKYGYNSIINTHIVELLPVEEYRYNVALDNAWIPLSFKFRESFPDDEIAFVSSDSTLSIENPIFEFNVPSCKFDMIAKFFAPLSENEFNYTFPTSMPVGATLIGNSIGGLLNYPKQNVYDESDLDTFYQAAA